MRFSLAKNSMLRNVGSLFATQMGTYAIPLMTVPYLTRVLGPEQFGLVAFMQAVALYVALIVDFGFGYSGTREVAQRRDTPDQISKVLGSVSGAKAILIVVVAVLFLVMQRFNPTMRDHRGMLWLAMFSGLAQGFSLMWYYQGIERMSLTALIDFLCKALGSATVFLVVHKPQDAPRVIAAQAFFLSVSTIWMHFRVHRTCGFSAPEWKECRASLKESFPLFLLRSAGGLFSSANALILGIYAGPMAVGFYSGPDKIVKACYGLQAPLSNSIYPRLVYLSGKDKVAARKLAVKSAALQIGGIIPVSFAVYFAAPSLIRAFMGPGYGPSVKVLRILCFMLIPAVTAAVVGLQWMVVQRMEKALNKITICAGLVNLLLAYFLVNRFRQNGMAFSVVAAESFVAVVSIIYLFVRKRMAPKSTDVGLEAVIPQ